MAVHAELVAPRYVVLTRLADSWIPRAALADPDNAEMEAFRWRRIYGPRHTRIAQLWLAEEQPAQPAPSGPVIDVTPLPLSHARKECTCLGWRELALRIFTLYLGFSLANDALELLIVLAG